MDSPLTITPRRGKRWIIFAITITGSLICCAGLVNYAVTPRNGILVESLEADLKNRLPLGSSWQQAHDWFASYGFQTDYISDSSGKVGLSTVIPNSSLLEVADIYIELYFSTTGALREHVIYRCIDGP
jgi:hypothetical protein